MNSSHPFSAALSATHHTAGTAGDLIPHANASVPALRSSRHFSTAGPTPAPTRPDLSGSVATSDVAQSGGPIRVQHDIQPGAIDTGVTATVALRLDAGRTGRLVAMSQGRRCFQQTGRIGMSGRWLWVGGMDAADLADHNQRPDGPPRESRDEDESLHGPTSIDRHARKKRLAGCTPPDAA